MDPFAVEVGNGEVATVVPFEHGPADWGRGLTPVVKPKLLGGGTPPTALTWAFASSKVMSSGYMADQRKLPSW